MSSCNDNPNYTSRYGLTCQQHEGLDCGGFAGLGFDPSEVDDLLKNCPSACSVDGCGDAASTRRTTSSSTSPPPPAWARQGQSMRELQAESLDDAEFSCYPGWEPTCQDDALYISRLKSPCEAHQQFDCRDTYLIGFSEEQVHELVNACPCSCGIECGTFTLSPTLAPTSSPTASPTPAPTSSTPQPTREPSSKPSAAPTTAAPTAQPSAAPTSAPTLAPTTAIPTAVPTIRPTTASPTASPSFLPSNIPTVTHSAFPSASPTFMPTSTPTVAPTYGPTITKTPTVPPTISAMPSASMRPSSTPTVPPTGMPTNTPIIVTPLDIQNNVATGNVDGKVKGAAIHPEQSGGSVASGAEGMDMNLLIIAVGAALIALMIIGVGVVLRKRLSRREEEYNGEDDDEDETFHDNGAKPRQQRDGVYGMATEGEPYISPDGVIYTRHEAKSNSKKKSKKHKRSQSKVSINEQLSGVEVRRMNTLSQYTGTTGTFSEEEAQSIHEPIAKISMMNGLRKSKMKKQQKKNQLQKKQKSTAVSHAQETDSHFDNATRMTGSDGQVVRVQKGLGRGRSRSRSKEGRSHSRSRSRSMPRQQQASAGQGQQRGRTRSRSIDSRKPKPMSQEKSFEASEQRIAEQIQRSRSRSRSRGRQSQSSVPHIEPMTHDEPLDQPGSSVQNHNLGNLPHISIVEADEEARHREHLQIEIGRSRSRSGRSQGGRYSQRAPRQASAEENPFTFVGGEHQEFETRQFEREVPARSPITPRRERPMPEPLENPNGVPTTIIGKNRKHKRNNSNGQSRGAFMITESDDEADESAVLNSDLFTDSLQEDEEEGTEYTDISAISSRSIRSRIWEQMAKDLAAREAAGMGPPMAPIHE